MGAVPAARSRLPEGWPLAYTAVVYWTFRGKVRMGEGGY